VLSGRLQAHDRREHDPSLGFANRDRGCLRRDRNEQRHRADSGHVAGAFGQHIGDIERRF